MDVTFLSPAVTIHSAIDQDKTPVTLTSVWCIGHILQLSGTFYVACAGSTRTCDRLPRRSFRVEPLTAAALEVVGLGRVSPEPSAMGREVRIGISALPPPVPHHLHYAP